MANLKRKQQFNGTIVLFALKFLGAHQPIDDLARRTHGAGLAPGHAALLLGQLLCKIRILRQPLRRRLAVAFTASGRAASGVVPVLALRQAPRVSRPRSRTRHPTGPRVLAHGYVVATRARTARSPPKCCRLSKRFKQPAAHALRSTFVPAPRRRIAWWSGISTASACWPMF